MRCTRCVLPGRDPDVILDDDGICNHCAHWQADRPQADPLRESDFVRILDKVRGRGRYDCLVMVSGGKDSVAALDYMKRRFHCEPLAFTFDHGIGNPDALENVRRATEILDVDRVFLQSRYMLDFFAEIVRRRAPVPICPVCSLWYMSETYALARQYDIRLVITGWTRGQLLGGGRSGTRKDLFPSLTRATRDFIRTMRREYPKYRRFPLTMDEVRRRHRKVRTLSPHWYLGYEEEQYRQKIADELDWRPVRSSYPRGSVNCYLNFLAAWLSNRDYGFNHHHIEMSQLIRLGEASRDEALEALRIDLDDPEVAEIVDGVLEALGCTHRHLRAGEDPP